MSKDYRIVDPKDPTSGECQVMLHRAAEAFVDALMPEDRADMIKWSRGVHAFECRWPLMARFSDEAAGALFATALHRRLQDQNR